MVSLSSFILINMFQYLFILICFGNVVLDQPMSPFNASIGVLEWTQKIGFLKRIRDYVNIDILKMIHNSILLPHIDYGCVIWGRCPNQVNVARICKLQKRAARVMLRCKIQDISSNEISKGWTGCHFRTECHINAAWWCLKFKII